MSAALGLAGLGAALVGCAVLFASPALAVPGVALALAGAWAPAWAALAARGTAVRRRVAPACVQEGDPLTVTVAVRRGRVRGGPAAVWDPVLGDATPAGDARPLTATTAFDRRGPRRLAGARLVVADPLGLAPRTAAVSAPDELLVLPRVHAVELPPELRGAAARAPAGPGPAEAALDFEGLGPYRPGAAPSRIHWAGLARHGELLERRFRSDPDRLPLVVLDARDPADDGALDAVVRAAASLVRALAAEGGCAALLPGDTRPAVVDADASGWPQLHRRLALAGPDGRMPAPAAVAAAGEAVAWVTAARRPRIPRLRAASAFVVTPHPRRGAPAFAAAECRAWRIGATRAEAA